MKVTNYKDIVNSFDKIIGTKIHKGQLVVYGKLNDKNIINSYKYSNLEVTKEVQNRVNYFICNIKTKG